MWLAMRERESAYDTPSKSPNTFDSTNHDISKIFNNEQMTRYNERISSFSDALIISCHLFIIEYLTDVVIRWIGSIRRFTSSIICNLSPIAGLLTSAVFIRCLFWSTLSMLFTADTGITFVLSPRTETENPLTIDYLRELIHLLFHYRSFHQGIILLERYRTDHCRGILHPIDRWPQNHYPFLLLPCLNYKTL